MCFPTAIGTFFLSIASNELKGKCTFGTKTQYCDQTIHSTVNRQRQYFRIFGYANDSKEFTPIGSSCCARTKMRTNLGGHGSERDSMRKFISIETTAQPKSNPKFIADSTSPASERTRINKQQMKCARRQMQLNTKSNKNKQFAPISSPTLAIK